MSDEYNSYGRIVGLHSLRGLIQRFGFVRGLRRTTGYTQRAVLSVTSPG